MPKQLAIELTLPTARDKGIGVIAKRPIANAVWRYEKVTEAMYDARYWHRLKKLDYQFLRGDARNNRGPGGPADVALRFALSVPGVATAIVGTSNPDRYRQNAELLRAGPLPPEVYAAIRARWQAVAGHSRR